MSRKNNYNNKAKRRVERDFAKAKAKKTRIKNHVKEIKNLYPKHMWPHVMAVKNGSISLDDLGFYD